jgi:hypothetical protein
MKPAALALALIFCAWNSLAADSNPVLQNAAIAWRANIVDGKLHPAQLKDKLNPNGATLAFKGECFRILLGQGQFVRCSDFIPAGPPRIEPLPAEPASPVFGRHFPGQQLIQTLNAPDHALSAEWRVMLREGATYVRQQLTLRAIGRDVLIREVVLFDEPVPGAKPIGTVDGSPVVASNFFFGYEHPMARNHIVDKNVRCAYERNALLADGESLEQSCVLGVVPQGQLRRGFLNYIERERAHPYRPFLHYNSWFDISWEDRKFNEAQSVDAISQFGSELIQKRGVHMASFLFDDGWDNNRTLWDFNGGFPNGFTPLRDAAAKYGVQIGVWLSPFGGYADARQQRLRYARQFGYETNLNGFSLAGPKYYARFREICLEMIKKYDVNQFKFDGLSAGSKAAVAGLTRDGDAMLRLLADLRAAKPDIFINQTTGTWPSPFWLLYVDSTWRGGEDDGFRGKGSARQRWMTYRDACVFRYVVAAGPLYPLNSLMVHGIIYAAHASRLDTADDGEFRDEARSYFGSGTQLQELYITPSFMSDRNWDDLAEAAKWSANNSDVLSDTHWIGGDPAAGQVYGWASWSPKKAVVVLRNPDDSPATFQFDAERAFELPPRARKNFSLHSPWKQDGKSAAIQMRAGTPFSFSLQPFEVLVLESQ